MIPRQNTAGMYMQQKTLHQGNPGASSQPEQIEPILKAKAILPKLKDSLIKMMQVSSQNVAVSYAIDDIQKPPDGSTIPSFNKCLEQFYTLCDQLELQLNNAYQQLSQGLVSTQHAPPLLSSVNLKLDPKRPQIYGSYCATVEQQLKFAKELYEILSHYAKKLDSST